MNGVLVDHTQLVKLAEITPPPQEIRLPDEQGYSEADNTLYFPISIRRPSYEGYPNEPVVYNIKVDVHCEHYPAGTRLDFYLPFVLRYFGVDSLRREFLMTKTLILGKEQLPERGMWGWEGVRRKPPLEVDVPIPPLVFDIPALPSLQIVVDVQKTKRWTAERDKEGRLKAIVASGE
jgi:hypothetical protein